MAHDYQSQVLRKMTQCNGMLRNTGVEKNITIPPFSVILTKRSDGRISAPSLHSEITLRTNVFAALYQVLRIIIQMFAICRRRDLF